LPGIVRDLYDRYKEKRTRPSLDEILRVLQSVVTVYFRVFIAIDALDECHASDSCRTRFISELFYLQAKGGVNILVTSRFIPEIAERLEGSMILEIRANEEDVGRYLDSHMSQLPAFIRRSSNLQNEINNRIIKAVGWHVSIISSPTESY
jgi:hypothetical protein